MFGIYNPNESRFDEGKMVSGIEALLNEKGMQASVRKFVDNCHVGVESNRLYKFPFYRALAATPAKPKRITFFSRGPDEKDMHAAIPGAIMAFASSHYDGRPYGRADIVFYDEKHLHLIEEIGGIVEEAGYAGAVYFLGETEILNSLHPVRQVTLNQSPSLWGAGAENRIPLRPEIEQLRQV